MEYQIFREGHRTALAIPGPEHIPLFLKWLNDPEIVKYTVRNFPISYVEEKEIIETLHKRVREVLIFLVLAKSEDAQWIPIGTIGLHKMNHLSRTVETGAMIGESEYQGKGYGSEAKLLLLKYAFDWLNYRLIYSKVLGSNQRSVAYSERCGYEICAVLKEHIWHAGQYHDDMTMVLNKERFDLIWDFYLKNKRAPRRSELVEVFAKRD